MFAIGTLLALGLTAGELEPLEGGDSPSWLHAVEFDLSPANLTADPAMSAAELDVTYAEAGNGDDPVTFIFIELDSFGLSAGSQPFGDKRADPSDTFAAIGIETECVDCHVTTSAAPIPDRRAGSGFDGNNPLYRRRAL
jgi:hypothetical protein